MGIKGLSSYIQARSEKCLENFKLHNSDIVIDGKELKLMIQLKFYFNLEIYYI